MVKKSIQRLEQGSYRIQLEKNKSSSILRVLKAEDQVENFWANENSASKQAPFFFPGNHLCVSNSFFLLVKATGELKPCLIEVIHSNEDLEEPKSACFGKSIISANDEEEDYTSCYQNLGCDLDMEKFRNFQVFLQMPREERKKNKGVQELFEEENLQSAQKTQVALDKVSEKMIKTMESNKNFPPVALLKTIYPFALRGHSLKGDESIRKLYESLKKSEFKKIKNTENLRFGDILIQKSKNQVSYKPNSLNSSFEPIISAQKEEFFSLYLGRGYVLKHYWDFETRQGQLKVLRISKNYFAAFRLVSSFGLLEYKLSVKTLAKLSKKCKQSPIFCLESPRSFSQ